MVEPYHVAKFADVAMPSVRRPYLHSQPRAAQWRKHGAAILLFFRIEQLPTGHGHEARLSVLFSSSRCVRKTSFPSTGKSALNGL